MRVPNTHASLLHDIVHCAWVPGKPSGYILPDWILGLAPTIKPMHAEPDTIPGNFVERYEERVSYMLAELAEIVEVPAEKHTRFSTYLMEAGLTNRRGEFPLTSAGKRASEAATPCHLVR